MAAHVGTTQRLSEKTICMASNFGENDEFLHYEVHNLYGYSHAMATQKYIYQQNLNTKYLDFITMSS